MLPKLRLAFGGSLSLIRFSKKLFAAVVGCILCAANLPAEDLPAIRPALIGSGPHSLVNLIDTEGLFRKGQRDAWVMFNCVLLGDGVVSRYDLPTTAIQRSEGAEALKAEVSRALINTRFIPAVYGHRRPLFSRFSGTVIFAVLNGKPHLRVFANQDVDELKRGSDFIAPQSVFQTGSAFWPSSPGHGAYLGLGAIVKIRHSVDATGKTTDVKVLSESPAGEDFGQAAAEYVRGSVYLPAYRNGKPTASTLTYNVRFGR